MNTTKQLLQSCCMAEVQMFYERGQIGQRVYDQYSRIWDWSSPRFGGCIGMSHNLWFRNNPTVYYARINRVRKVLGLSTLEIGYS